MRSLRSGQPEYIDIDNFEILKIKCAPRLNIACLTSTYRYDNKVLSKCARFAVRARILR